MMPSGREGERERVCVCDREREKERESLGKMQRREKKALRHRAMKRQTDGRTVKIRH